MFRRTVTVLAPITAVTACIPYTVGTTAQPVAVGDRSTTMSTFVMPSFARLDSTHSFTKLAIDFESRWGIDERSDLGIRVPSGSGLIVNYKHLISDPKARTKVAIMPGAGFVNLGQHAHFELTLLASGYEPPRAQGSTRDTTVRPLFVPFGGLRAMQVAPLAEGAVNDRPTAGGFLGVRIGSADFGISPEVGVFYDHSALGVRRGDFVIVPAISVHGDRLIDMIREMMGRGRRGIFVLESYKWQSQP